MISAPLLRQIQLRNLSQPTTSKAAPNHFYFTFSSTCAPAHISPSIPPNLLAVKHFRFLRSLSRNRSARLPPNNRLDLAYGRIVSLVLSTALVAIISWSPCLAQQKVSGPPLSGTE